MTYSTVNVDGLIIRTAWDSDHVGPTELLITIDHTSRTAGKGIADRMIHRLSLQSMCPESMKTKGSLRAVGDWLEDHKPGFRQRPHDPSLWYAHVALFFVLAVESGEKGVPNILANYTGVRPSKAREWIEIAKRLGMLATSDAKCRTGRAYGTLTDRARIILATGELVNEEEQAA